MPEACNFIKKETQVQGFPVNFAKFLRTPFLTEHLWATASIFPFSKVTSTDLRAKRPGKTH